MCKETLFLGTVFLPSSLRCKLNSPSGGRITLELKSELVLVLKQGVWWEEGWRAGARRIHKAGNGAVLLFSCKSYVMV